MQLYLIRHAQSTNNALDDFAERVPDPLLTDLGERQKMLLAQHLQQGSNLTLSIMSAMETPLNFVETEPSAGYGIARLYCSAMARALQTAKPISQTLNLTPEVWPDIHERGGIYLDPLDDADQYFGKTRSEILAEYPTYQLPDTVTDEGWWPGGYEHPSAFLERATRVAQQLKSWASRNERIALVTHAGFMNALLQAIFDQTNPHLIYRHYNTAITRIDFFPNGRIHLVYLNRVEHLPEPLVS
ncbi:MAG: histidine phosphatase family protein [Chloroflexota bacterium]